ncbi:cytochrome d ubiquinol oxidase subunit II [Halorussus salilacus]|uniref:cytochrome d ubiquinol oxidase subunit II n=1 Tax=Halorussus salilacus TaxID=2953750 RepID=UPI00209EAAF6|nr:cytochrome d ubiquinol oxidase subunit II [Halorussus salilacus]USZ66976.1 cytochrome d ubiquinol oxidase subunit II [Halorussus salilacus]
MIDLPVSFGTLWFGIVFAFLGVFLFLDGWDFGVGAIFATREDPREREQCLAAIGPFWDGNEVWLVVFGGALFAAFPPVYAALFSRHYLLLFGVLGALILRGLAPEMYEQRHDEAWHRWWGRAFVVGSVGAPLLLGIFVGNWLVGATGLALTSVVVGLAVVALTVVSGAAFLALKVRGPLREEMAHYGTRAVVAYLALVVVALAGLWTRPAFRAELLTGPALALVAVSVVLAGGYAVAIRRDRRYAALAASGGLTGALVALVAWLRYPVVDPVAGLTVESAIIGSPAVELLTVGAAILIPLVVTYFAVLYSAFSGPIDAEEAY